MYMSRQDPFLTIFYTTSCALAEKRDNLCLRYDNLTYADIQNVNFMHTEDTITVMLEPM